MIYLGTVSKTLSPELRLGYLVVPHELTSSFALAKRLMDRHSALLQQRTLHVFVENGGLERHIRRARRINAKRRATLLSELQRMLGDRGDVAGEAAGLHIVLWLNGIGSELEDAFVAKAGEQRLGLYGITPFYADKQHRHTEPRAEFVMDTPPLAIQTLGEVSIFCVDCLTGCGASTRSIRGSYGRLLVMAIRNAKPLDRQQLTFERPRLPDASGLFGTRYLKYSEEDGIRISDSGPAWRIFLDRRNSPCFIP